MKMKSRQNAEDRLQTRGDACNRCGGTGLICGHVPVIGPGSCCVDYANAVCPECKGRGVEGEEAQGWNEGERHRSR